jgi:hypothetical protein
MKTITKLSMIILLLATACDEGGELVTADVQTYRVTAAATPVQPVLQSNAAAEIKGWYYKEINILSFTLSWNDLWSGTGNLVALSIHSTVDGSLVRRIAIDNTSPAGSLNLAIAGNAALVGKEIDDLLAGEYYFLLTTSALPTGVVRGALVVAFKDPATFVPNLVTDIILDDGSPAAVFIEDKEQAIDALVVPVYADNRAIKWESSDTTVLRVDQQGRAIGVNVGFAVITVTALDGGGTSTTLSVEVINPDKVGSITLAPANQYNLLDAGASTPLVVTVLPETALNKRLEYVSSSPGVATVDADGVVTGHAAGETTITISTTDDTGLTLSCKVIVGATLVEYDRGAWDISCSSEKVSDGGGKMMILGNDPARYWHSMWSPNSPLPHWIEIDMKEDLELNKISISRRSGNTDTRVVIVSTSLDGVGFTPLRTVDFAGSSDVSRDVIFPTLLARYIRLDITESNRSPFANLSVLRVYRIE